MAHLQQTINMIPKKAMFIIKGLNQIMFITFDTKIREINIV
jgi:hypothetical protein